MKLYYFILLDYTGQEVETSDRVFGSSKHAAFVATKTVDSIPPCQGFRIKCYELTSHDVARMVSSN